VCTVKQKLAKQKPDELKQTEQGVRGKGQKAKGTKNQQKEVDSRLPMLGVERSSWKAQAKKKKWGSKRPNHPPIKGEKRNQ